MTTAAAATATGPERKTRRYAEGLVDKAEIAELFGVTVRTLDRWLKGWPEFPSALPIPSQHVALWRRAEVEKFLNGAAAA